MKWYGPVYPQVTLIFTGFVKVFVLLSALPVGPAQAHVKRFADVRPSDVARPIGDVLTDTTFVNLFLLSVFAIYTFFWLDRWFSRKALLAQLDERMKHFDS